MNPLITSKPVTDGQKSQFVTVVSDAVRKSIGTLIDELSENGMLNSENFQGILGSGNHLVTVINQTVKDAVGDLVGGVRGCLKLISGHRKIFIPSTDGTETLAEATGVFGRIDPNFNDMGLNRSSQPTRRQQIEVYRVVETGSFKRIFTSLRKNLDALCLTQSQISVICCNYDGALDVGSPSISKLFLFKVGQEIFVAWFYPKDYGTRKIFAYRLDDDREGRLVPNGVEVFLPKQ